MSFIWLVLCVRIVNAVYLNGGACPKLVSTHFLGNISSLTTMDVIVGVAYSEEHPSHLYKNINESTSGGYIFNLLVLRNLRKEQLEITIGYNNSKLYTSKHSGLISRQARSFPIKSVIIPQNTSETIYPRCHRVLSDDIKIWMDGGFLIIWSCIHGFYTHDEAVLMLAQRQSQDQQMFDEMIEELKRTAKKYLTRELVNEISWPTERGRTLKGYEPYHCSFKDSLRWVILILCFWLVLIGSATWLC